MITGRDLRRARESRGVGLRDLAKSIGKDKGHLSRVERGVEDREVTPALIRDYERVLGLTIAGAGDIGIAGQTTRAAAVPSGPAIEASLTATFLGPASETSRVADVAAVAKPSDTGEMLRRTLIIVLATFGVGRLPGDGDGGSSASTVDARHSDSELVEDWCEAAQEYGCDYLPAPRSSLVADLSADLLEVQALRSRVRDSGQQHALSAVAARLAGLAAMACTDLGYSREVKHLWRIARRMADTSAAPDVQLWVRGHETTVGIYHGRPLPTILDLAERGLAIRSQVPTAGRAELLGGKAQALALQGRAREATETLREMQQMFGGLPADVTGNTDSIYACPEYRLRHAESFVYTAIGAIKRAHGAQDRALELYPKTRLISRAQIEMHRAECLVHSGDVTDGVKHASDIFERLPIDRRKQFVRKVATKVWSAVPESERTRPDVLEFRDQLIASATKDPHAQ